MAFAPHGLGSHGETISFNGRDSNVQPVKGSPGDMREDFRESFQYKNIRHCFGLLYTCYWDRTVKVDKGCLLEKLLTNTLALSEWIARVSCYTGAEGTMTACELTSRHWELGPQGVGRHGFRYNSAAGVHNNENSL
uniref:Uncharacterized protein n=1 Tax=Glossina austeni TaxID=7395 RepID=A0A1A9VW33_GLOAU